MTQETGIGIPTGPILDPLSEVAMLDAGKVLRDAERFFKRFSKGGVGLLEGMLSLLDYCEQAYPAKLWANLRELDYDADYDRLTIWLTELLRAEPPGPSISGFWFGLFNPESPNGEESCGLYLAGSRRFRPDKPDPDWHCDPEYWPKGRYADSEILPVLYQRPARLKGEDRYLGESVLCLGFVCLIMARWCYGPWRSRLLGKAPHRGVAFGHDAGDVHLVTVLRRDGGH